MDKLVSNLEQCSVVVLDIAGTTTSHTFIKTTLFEFVNAETEAYLKSHWGSLREIIEQLKNVNLELEAAVTLVKQMTEQNSDNIGLKTIQGLIYKHGYESGVLKAHVFADVPAALETWSKSRKICIYSTGSIEAQKLLFSHTVEGDLSSYINNYFDQSIGMKTEKNSYGAIAEQMHVKVDNLIFITDDIKEAQAAKAAGAEVARVIRDGNSALPEGASKDFCIISSFKEIAFDNL